MMTISNVDYIKCRLSNVHCIAISKSFLEQSLQCKEIISKMSSNYFFQNFYWSYCHAAARLCIPGMDIIEAINNLEVENSDSIYFKNKINIHSLLNINIHSLI